MNKCYGSDEKYKFSKSVSTTHNSGNLKGRMMTATAFSAPEKKNTIYSVQLLRAIAALLVVFDHGLIHILTAYDVPQEYHVMAWKLGGIGVTIFFVISGFVMALTNDRKFGQPAEPLQFMLNRIIRIVPLYWVMTFVAAALTILTTGKEVSFSYLLMSLFFIVPQDASGQVLLQPVLGPGWTLTYEMFFYAVFALFLLLPKRAGVTGFTITMLALVFWGMTTLSSAEINDPTSRFAFYANPLLLLFVSGVLLGVVYKKYEASFEQVNIGIIWMIAAVAVTITCSILTDKNSWPLYLQPIVFVLPLLCVAIALVSRFEPVTLSRRFGILLGEASYSIYLSHILFLAVLRKILPAGTLYGTLYLTAAIAGSIITGILIYKLIEMPLTNIARKYLRLKKRQTVAA